ncbi:MULTISPECIES: hypothetical protein [unclassified Microcoleus]|uniref:hypothetical protein n=1 Tax=unclassified Microcoleus TaxID=2642155 RepID=UPI002FD0701C
MPNQDRGILGNASFECRRSRRNLPLVEIPLEWRNGDILVISSLTDLTFAFSEETGTI